MITKEALVTKAVWGSGKKPYIVRIFAMGEGAYCTCPSWQFKKGQPAAERTCKHVELVLQNLDNNDIPTDDEDLS